AHRLGHCIRERCLGLRILEKRLQPCLLDGTVGCNRDDDTYGAILTHRARDSAVFVEPGAESQVRRTRMWQTTTAKPISEERQSCRDMIRTASYSRGSGLRLVEEGHAWRRSLLDIVRLVSGTR